MKNFSLYCLLLIASLFAAACETSTNTNTVTNTNTGNAAPAAAAPTKEDLMTLDRKAAEAFFKNDIAHFEGMLSNNYVSYMDGRRSGRTEELSMVRTVKCDMKSWNLEDPQMIKVDNDTYAVSYKGTYDGTCTWEGKTVPAPSSVRAASVWHREGGTWKNVFHAETPIIAAGSPAAASSPAAPAASPAANTNTANTAANSAANSNSNMSNSNTSAAPSAPAASPNTQALLTLHRGGWDAWKNRDKAWFETNVGSSVGLVDPMGGWHGTKADVIKLWTETMQCQGVTDIQLTDAHSTAVSPTVEILTLKGTANGTCDGQPNGPLYQSNVYVKEGNAWKLAFMFEQPGK